MRTKLKIGVVALLTVCAADVPAQVPADTTSVRQEKTFRLVPRTPLPGQATRVVGRGPLRKFGRMKRRDELPPVRVKTDTVVAFDSTLLYQRMVIEEVKK